MLLVALCGALVFGAGVASYWRESPVVPLLFAMPVVSGTAMMMALGHHLWPRFFFFAAGFAILIVVRGVNVGAAMVGRLLQWPSARATWVGAVCTVLLIAVFARSLPYVYRPKQDFAGARDFVERSKRPGDAVVAVGIAALPYRLYFAPGWQTASTLTELEQIEQASTATWLVYTLPIELENTYGDIYAAAQRNFRLVRTFDGSLGDGAIYVRRSERPTSRDRASVRTAEGS